MPKATLSFTLPEEQDEFHHAINGVVYFGVLTDFDQELCQKIKGDQPPPKDWHEVREMFREVAGSVEF